MTRYIARLRVAAITIAGLLWCAAPTSANAEMVHSLDGVVAALRTPEARSLFAWQMSGEPPPDRLGSALPAGLSRDSLSALLLPSTRAGEVGTVGALPWPAHPGWFVAIACTGPAAPAKRGIDGCTGSQEQPTHAVLAVVSIGANGAPKTEAPPIAVDPSVNWTGSLLPNGPAYADDPGAGGNPPPPSFFERLDLAPYRIAPDIVALGLVADWQDGLAGGFGLHGALLLYAIEAGRLHRVLSVPVMALTDVAADWNRDGTRAHDIQDGANIVVVSRHATDGHFDLVVRSRPGRRMRLFRWQASSDAYGPAEH